MKSFARYSFTLSLALAACGDDAKQTPTDAPAPTPDAPVDAAPGYTPPIARLVPISTGGPDQLQSVVAGPDNTFIAAGFFAETPTGPRSLTVFKLTDAGLPVTTFGAADGLADGFSDITQVAFRGGNDEIDVALQADGKILISLTVAATASAVANDTDIAVVRLLADGSLDPSFDTDGIAVIDLNAGLLSNATPPAPVADAARGLVVNADGIYVHAASRALGDTRLDQDFTVVRLTTAGAVDETFGDQTAAGKKGQFRLGFGGNSVAPRAIKALDGGKLLAVGYADTVAVGNQPVIYKLTAAGQLDTTFNPTGTTPGLFHETVFGHQTEVYNLAIHGDKFVTGGYGRLTETPNINSYISLRFDLATGARDLTWGGATDGIVMFDPSGTGLTSNCRGAFALPNGKTLLIGSTGAGGPVQDAVFAVLDATGKLDTTYGTGVNKYKLGADGNDQFWGAAVAGSRVVVVGYKGESVQAADINDNAYGLLFTAE